MLQIMGRITMNKIEIGILSNIPQIKKIIENERVREEINAIQKIAKEEKKNRTSKENIKLNLELSFDITLCSFLNELGTSLDELKEKTGIPKEKIKEFFIEFFSEKIFQHKRKRFLFF